MFHSDFVNHYRRFLNPAAIGPRIAVSSANGVGVAATVIAAGPHQSSNGTSTTDSARVPSVMAERALNDTIHTKAGEGLRGRLRFSRYSLKFLEYFPR